MKIELWVTSCLNKMGIKMKEKKKKKKKKKGGEGGEERKKVC